MFIDIHTHDQQFSDEDLELLVNNSKKSTLYLFTLENLGVCYRECVLNSIRGTCLQISAMS